MSESITSLPPASSVPSPVEPSIRRDFKPSAGAWISFIVLAALLIGALVAYPPFTDTDKAVPTPQWALMFGRFHPIAVHLPVGVLFLVLLMEIFSLFKGRASAAAMRSAITFALGFAVFGSIVTVLFGIIRAREGGFSTPTFRAHEFLGITTAVGALVTYFLKIIADGTGRVFSLYRLSLLMTVLVMSVGGHFGGNMVHGSSYLVKHTPPDVRKGIEYAEKLVLAPFEAAQSVKEKQALMAAAAEVQTPAATKPTPEPAASQISQTPPASDAIPTGAASPEPQPAPAPASVATPPGGAAADSVYASLIAPLLEEKCNSCHNEDKDQGGLRLDNHELILAGGDSGDNVIPGDPDKSLMVFRMMLPVEDDERMPPDGKPQPTPEEVALVTWWIKEGASKDLKVSEAKFPANLAPLLKMRNVASYSGSAGSTASVLATAAEGVSDATLAIAEAMKNLNGTGSVLAPANVEPAQLRFSAMNAAATFDDAKLKQLEPIAEHITILDLAKTKITDAALPVIARMKHLQELNIKETAVTQQAAEKALASHKGLKLTANWKTAAPPAPTVAAAKPNPAPAPAPKPEAKPAAAGGEGPPGDAMVFNQVILPILQNKCASCHGEERAKGKLRVHNFADLMKGGSEGDVTVIPGKAADSLLLIRAELPEDDDERMPPIDEPQLTKEELQLLKWWVEQGASETVTVAAIKKTPEIEGFLKAYAKVKPVESKPAEAAPKPKKLTDAEKKAIAEVSAKMVALSATFMPISLETPGQLRFAAVNAADKFGDKEIALLSPAALHVLWADLGKTKITDAGLAYVAGMDNLEKLHLENTAVTDEGLSHLARLTKLEYLNLYGTKVTDAGLARLAANKGLKKLFVWQTAVTKDGARKLEEAIPGLTVNVGLTEADVAKLIEAAKPKPPEPAPAPAAKKEEPKPAPAPAAKKEEPKPAEKKPEAAAKPAPAPAAEKKPDPAPAPPTEKKPEPAAAPEKKPDAPPAPAPAAPAKPSNA